LQIGTRTTIINSLAKQAPLLDAHPSCCHAPSLLALADLCDLPGGRAGRDGLDQLHGGAGRAVGSQRPTSGGVGTDHAAGPVAPGHRAGAAVGSRKCQAVSCLPAAVSADERQSKCVESAAGAQCDGLLAASGTSIRSSSCAFSVRPRRSADRPARARRIAQVVDSVASETEAERPGRAARRDRSGPAQDAAAGSRCAAIGIDAGAIVADSAEVRE
jgi:hypothetical protein